MQAIKLQKIDEFLLKEYSHLELGDHCYFIGEYAARQGFNYSEMNQVINNFKKPVDRKNLPEWRYKEDHLKNLTVDDSKKNPTPQAIIFLDDIITSGANFKAAQKIIKNEFPGVPSIGVFVARNIRVSSVR